MRGTIYLSPDTLVPDPTNPQSFNRYSYTFNNPLKYTDPSGHCPICLTALIGAATGAVVDYSVQVTTNVSANGWSADAFTNIDGGQVLIFATVGV